MSGDIGASIGRAASDSTPATVANMLPTLHQQYTFDGLHFLLQQDKARHQQYETK
jgi:hypothetical protein